MARKLITLLFAGLFMANTAHATHVTGAEIIWNCVGNGQYDFSLIIYRDCAGTTLDQTYTLDMTSPCGNTSVTVTQQSFTEVSQLCPDDIGNSSCNGGPLPGIQAYIYTGSLSNLAPCDSWTISWDLCCRNNAIVNLTDPGNQDGYIEAVMNNADFPCNDSPQFTNAPIPYVCLGSPVFYSYGAFDPDGDSLSYSFVSAMGGGGAPLGYNFPYSAIEPITGITLDPLTGLVSFTPTVQGNFVVVVQVQEFDGNGNLIGTVLRDMQFVAIPCTNNPPNPFAGAIQNFNGSAIQTGDFSIELCESNNFCFTATYDDPDATDTLSLTSNILQNLPGTTITYTGINPVTATICWTAQPGTSGFFPFTVTVEDDACPINGEQTFVYAVNVLQRTSAGPDQTICGPQVAQLQAEGGSLFTWSVMSGDPMQLGVNFSCNPCDAPIADPNNTTTYIVVSDLAGTCINSDTVTVNVVPDFSFLATQSDTLICLGETVDFNVAVNPNVPGYQFEWIPDEGLTSSSIPNPTGIYGNPGYYTYNVGITSPDGCYHQDTSLAVTVTPGYVPQFSVSQNDSLVCEGNSTQFFVDLDCSLPGFCGTYDGPCCGPISTMDVGDGTDYLANTAYPAIYGQWYTGARHQILFTASELQALGFAGGKISEIGWNIAQIPATAATTFYQFEMKIGCTTQEELISGAWISGLTTVFPADTIQIVPGWNTYQFDHGFNWDGTSNLVVEVCFDFWDLFGTDFTLNSPTYYTTTAFNSVHQWHSDQGGICSDTPNGFAIESVETERPNTRFVFCGGVSADELTYTWTPAIGLDDPSAQNPVVTPQSAPTTYTVTVGELGSGCAASADLTVGWFPPANVSFVPNPDEGVFPLTVFFQNTSASGSNNFNWNFGDGNGSGDSDPNHIYVDPGTYYITLTGLSENGCFGTYTDSIVVLPNPIVEIPNVFSPDNDGHNDVFEYIDLRGFRNVKMTIYDRWGTVVYEAPATTSNKVIWQPKAQVNDGTYFYLFEGQGNDGSDVKRQGHITLVRRPK